jgi:hypothetical protein
VVEIERFPCRFGGDRAYFRCPTCSRRCLFLYRPPNEWDFACRECLQLIYEAETDTSYAALRRRQRKLEERLGPHRSKPARMHWRTFWGIRKALDEIAAKANRLLVAAYRAMTA